MKLIIGLGNPGEQYTQTWHNLGFDAIQLLQKKYNLPLLTFEKKFKANISIGLIGEEKVLLAEPQTFMNKSGEAVSRLMNFYKLSLKDIIVIHDDIDLPLGTLRIVSGSSAAGHNGVKSIIEDVDSQEFVRLRLGVRTERIDTVGAINYVLERYQDEHTAVIDDLLDRVVQASETIISSSVAAAMNKFNQ
jgi:PTH1 family peptidyl-tRNA hydrolase